MNMCFMSGQRSAQENFAHIIMGTRELLRIVGSVLFALIDVYGMHM